MKSPKIIYIIILTFTLTSCWDSFVNSRDRKNKDTRQKIDSIKIDSNSNRPYRQNQKRPKGTKDLDTLKPGIAGTNTIPKAKTPPAYKLGF